MKWKPCFHHTRNNTTAGFKQFQEVTNVNKEKADEENGIWEAASQGVTTTLFPLCVWGYHLEELVGKAAARKTGTQPHHNE